MIIRVKVKTGSQKESLQKVEHPDFDYKDCVKAQREKGKANNALVKLLSKEFNTSQNNIEIQRGLTSTIKYIYIQK